MRRPVPGIQQSLATPRACVIVREPFGRVVKGFGASTGREMPGDEPVLQPGETVLFNVEERMIALKPDAFAGIGRNVRRLTESNLDRRI